MNLKQWDQQALSPFWRSHRSAQNDNIVPKETKKYRYVVLDFNFRRSAHLMNLCRPSVLNSRPFDLPVFRNQQVFGRPFLPHLWLVFRKNINVSLKVCRILCCVTPKREIQFIFQNKKERLVDQTDFNQT